MVKPQQKDINVPHAELGHLSKVVNHATDRAMGLHISDIFRLCEDYALEKAKKSRARKKMLSTQKLWD